MDSSNPNLPIQQGSSNIISIGGGQPTSINPTTIMTTPTINVLTNINPTSNTTTSNGSTLIHPNNNNNNSNNNTSNINPNTIPKPIITTIHTPHIQQTQQQQNRSINNPPPPVFQVQVPAPHHQQQQQTSSIHSPSPNMSSSSSHNITPTYTFSTPSHHQQQQHHHDTSGFALSDFLMQLEDYTPTIPDAVANYYLHMVGFDSTDPRMSRLISIAAQKFISDIINEAFTHCKLKGQAQTGGNSKTKSKEKKYVLTMEDLIPILNEYGITVKKPPYYV